jgi:hypothetical protein
MIELAMILGRPEGRAYVFNERSKSSKINLANKLQKSNRDLEVSKLHKKYKAMTLHTQVCIKFLTPYTSTPSIYIYIYIK